MKNTNIKLTHSENKSPLFANLLPEGVVLGNYYAEIDKKFVNGYHINFMCNKGHKGSNIVSNINAPIHSYCYECKDKYQSEINLKNK